jgi:hypothetical protein
MYLQPPDIHIHLSHIGNIPIIDIDIRREIVLCDEVKTEHRSLWSKHELEDLIDNYGFKTQYFYEALANIIDTKLTIYLAEHERLFIKQEVALLVSINLSSQ